MATTLRQTLALPVQWMSVATATLLVSPVLYISFLAFQADGATWSRLWSTRVPELLWNTLSLAASVSVLTFLLGFSLAWLIVRYEFPGRRVWEWALVLPLAMPTYVLAYVYAHLLGMGGPMEQWWQSLFGREAHILSPHSFLGVSLIMALDTFPFVYLLARGALLNMNASYEEAARVCGVRPRQTLWRVTLPLIRPAIVAGLALVVLYVVSDFGAISLLRYQTLTYAVYQQMTGRYDQAAASILSVLLVLMALLFLVVERWFRRRSRFYQTTGRYRTIARKRCGVLGTSTIMAFVILVFASAFGLPAAMLAELGIAEWRAGRTDAARDYLRQVAELDAHGGQGYSQAALLSTLGERQAAIRALERAFDERSSDLSFVGLDPVFDPLRGEARFEALRERLRTPRAGPGD